MCYHYYICVYKIFENKGAVMGCSNPHPHCQIWASSFLPSEPLVKDRNLREHKARNGTNLLLEYAEQEEQRRERVSK